MLIISIFTNRLSLILQYTNTIYRAYTNIVIFINRNRKIFLSIDILISLRYISFDKIILSNLSNFK